MPRTIPASVLGTPIASRGFASIAVSAVAIAGLRQLGQAEVEDLDAPVPGDEQVLGLQVAVDDALVVGGGEPAGDLRGESIALRGGIGVPSSRWRSVSPSSSSETT